MGEVRPTTFGDLISRGVLEIGDGYRAKNAELGGKGPIFLRAGQLTARGWVWEGERFHQDQSSRFSSKMARVGDTVITTKGNSTGRTGFVPTDAPDFVYSPHLSFWRSKDAKQLDSRFLRYWALSSEFVSQVKAMAHSTDMAPYLSLADQKRLKISLPRGPVQRAVGLLLSTLDDKITVNERIAASSSYLAGSIFLAASGRQSAKLINIAEVTMGQSPPGDTYNEKQAGIPFYQGTRDFGFRFPNHRVWCTAVTRYANKGDILVSVRAPVGRINVAAEACGIGRGLAAVHAQTHQHVLLHALSADTSVWTPYEAEGTVFGSINKKQLTNVEINWPAPEHLDALETKLKALDEQVEKVSAESRTLAALRDTLLPQLMSGKLRVRDAERIVEDAV